MTSAQYLIFFTFILFADDTNTNIHYRKNFWLQLHHLLTMKWSKLTIILVFAIKLWWWRRCLWWT